MQVRAAVQAKHASTPFLNQVKARMLHAEVTSRTVQPFFFSSTPANAHLICRIFILFLIHTVRVHGLVLVDPAIPPDACQTIGSVSGCLGPGVSPVSMENQCPSNFASGLNAKQHGSIAMSSTDTSG